MTESMRDYQRTKGKYILPREVYHQTIWIIRDYYRLKEEAEAILHESPGPSDGQPHGMNGISDPNAAKAIQRERLVAKTDAIDKALACLPAEYRAGVWQNILYYMPMPMDAGRATYGRWKARFVWEVANSLKLI
jgi:hypothetical protein